MTDGAMTEHAAPGDRSGADGTGEGPGDGGLIDWARVDELRDEVGADGFDDIVALFLDEADEVMERLGTGPDPARLEHDLHFLKGSALNLGFARFAELCALGEDRAAAGETAAVDLAPIRAAYARSRARLLGGAAARSAA